MSSPVLLKSARDWVWLRKRRATAGEQRVFACTCVCVQQCVYAVEEDRQRERRVESGGRRLRAQVESESVVRGEDDARREEGEWSGEDAQERERVKERGTERESEREGEQFSLSVTTLTALSRWSFPCSSGGGIIIWNPKERERDTHTHSRERERERERKGDSEQRKGWEEQDECLEVFRG